MRIAALPIILIPLFSLPISAALAVESGSIRTLPVPRETIYPGDTVRAEDLTGRQFKTSPRSLAGVATDPAEVIGKSTRRRLLAGMPVPLGALGIRPLVSRGTSAPAYYREDGFSIATQVLILSDGAEGDIIDTRALETGAIIKVEVLPGGELAVLGK